jgi:hypothetical protein
MKRITEAFCLQLKRIVSIEEARATFEHTGRAFDEYDFRCAEHCCRKHDVRIIGVNYRAHGDGTPRYVDHHFRRWDPHEPECRYYLPDHLDHEHAAPVSGAHAQRHAPLAIDRLPIFDPRPRQAPAFDENAGEGGGHGAADTGEELRRRSALGDELAARPRRTRSLETLVDTYRDARTSPNFHTLELQVIGKGTIPLRSYVLPVVCARPKTRGRILYGGAYYVRDYGEGFKLRFIDRLAGARLYVYVSPRATAGGLSARAAEVLARMKRGDYATAYVLGDPVLDRKTRTYSMVVEALDRIALRAPHSNHAHAHAPETLSAGMPDVRSDREITPRIL